MIITPKIRGFLCTTAHPLGIQAQVKSQIDRAGSARGPRKRALIIGSSMGYGLSSRIALMVGYEADTVGIHFDRPAQPEKGRTATAGGYATQAFTTQARARGRFALDINGDAFSDEIKEQAIQEIAKNIGQVDVVVYSLAAPVRTDPTTGQLVRSCLKPIGEPFTSKTLDIEKQTVEAVTLSPATETEIDATVKVMGGEDWQRWMDALEQSGVIAPNCISLAYSYIGPKLTYPIYTQGTIGRAKQDLERAAKQIDEQLRVRGGRAYVSVNKALVTQASSAIPVVPLYISILYRVMKQKGLHEGCLEQMHRLFSPPLFERRFPVDTEGRLRLDDWEMRDDVQQEVMAAWENVTTENLLQYCDIDGYREDFMNIFGFAVPGVRYDEDVPLSDVMSFM